jgi:hypothetical protein
VGGHIADGSADAISGIEELLDCYAGDVSVKGLAVWREMV